MKRKFRSILKQALVLLCLYPCLVYAQGKGDTLLTRKFNYFVYPYVFYTPETQLAFGGGGILYFNLAVNPILKPSKVVLAAYYTSNGQYYLKIAPSLYFPGYNNYQLESNLNFGKEESRFYGIGNDTPELQDPEYHLNSFNLKLELRFKSFIFNFLKFGLLYDFSTNQIDPLTNPILRKDTPTPGADGGIVSGIGISYSRDTRDNLFFPYKGYFVTLSFTAYPDWLGGAFTYQKMEMDIRHYVDLGERHILAVQVYGHFLWGTVPFFRMAEMGGDQLMRGYFRGRYRDRRYLAGQIEYRKMVWWKLGYTLFAAAGQVSPHWDGFSINKFKTAVGVGLRFVLDKQERLHIRVDAGFSKNSDGIYFAIEEAF